MLMQINSTLPIFTAIFVVGAFIFTALTFRRSSNNAYITGLENTVKLQQQTIEGQGVRIGDLERRMINCEDARTDLANRNVELMSTLINGKVNISKKEAK